MLFGTQAELESRQSRFKTLAVSAVVHLVLIGLVVFNPDWLQSTPKRVVHLSGQDYSLDQYEIRELDLPPLAEPRPPAIAESVPVVPLPEPPAAEAAPPPPPPPAPPPPPPPDVLIGPDDVLAEGARPDAAPQASRGVETPVSPGAPAAPEPEPAPAPRPETNNGSAGDGPPLIAQNTNPNALQLPSLLERANQIVDQQVEETYRRFQQGAYSTGSGGMLEDPNFSTVEPTILSDTRGYDFGPYMNQVINRVRLNWYSLIPEVARLGQRGQVTIIFEIGATGVIQDLRVVRNSGNLPLDRAAQGAITASNPFQRLPADFDGDRLVLQFTFLYNMR